MTTEPVQNVVQHTDDGGGLRLSRQPDAIPIEVADTSADLLEERAANVRAISGRGMRLIAAVAGRWCAHPAT